MATAETLNVGTPVPQQQAKAAPKGAKAPQAREAEDEGPPAGRPTEIQWFRVMEDCEVPNRTGKYMLKRGKVLSTKEYSLQELKDGGVKLEETTEPAWHRKLQETGRSFAR
jgi:hypothetical protein